MIEDRKIKILCVEDEREIRENIADILRDEGFEVFESANGKQGFEVFMQNKPDLVISDIMMPELDGYGLLHLIRESQNVRNNNVPFIFLTALGQKDDVIKGVNMTANDYLIKPIDFDLMIAKIKEKTVNSLKVQEDYDRNVKNLKSQVSLVLSSDLFSYLDVITQVSSLLRQQPYGPLPHRNYLEDFDKIYINTMKLRSAITNALDENVIDQKLNAQEEVFSLFQFLNDFISSLSDKLKSRIKMEKPFESQPLPRIKLDRLIFLDAMRRILAGMFKSDPEATLSISMMVDHLNQMVIIFYLKSAMENAKLAENIDEVQISKILDKQNCRFEIIEAKENTAILIIPSHRLIH